MTTKVYKQLATKQDLAIGLGTVEQQRNGINLVLDKINFAQSGGVSLVGNAGVHLDSVADMQAAPWLGDLVDGTVITTHAYNAPVITRWFKTTVAPTEGFVLPGVGCFLQLVHDQTTTPVDYGAIRDVDADYSAEIQAFLDYGADAGLTLLNLGGAYTLYTVNMDERHDGCCVAFGELKSIGNRAEGEVSLVKVEPSVDMEYLGFYDLKLEGRAVWTGDAAADDIANLDARTNHSGIKVVCTLNSRIKTVYADKLRSESLGLDTLTTELVDTLVVGSIEGQYVNGNLLKASLATAQEIYAWPTDFTPVCTVQSLLATECGAPFTFGTAGQGTEIIFDGFTDVYRPQASVGKSVAVDCNGKTGVANAWDFDAEYISGYLRAYALNPDGHATITFDGNHEVLDIKHLSATGTFAAFECEANRFGALHIGKLYVNDCQRVGQGAYPDTKIEDIRATDCGGLIFCKDISTQLGSTSMIIDSLSVLGANKDHWDNNSPPGWYAVSSTFFFHTNFDIVKIGILKTWRLGSANAANVYGHFMQVGNNSMCHIGEAHHEGWAGQTAPGTLYYLRFDGATLRIDSIKERAPTPSAVDWLIRVDGAADVTLELGNMDVLSPVLEEFNGTLKQQGPGLWTWIESGAMRFSVTKPTVITDGAPI